MRNTPSMEIFNIVKCGERPLCRITSFIACIIGSSLFVKSSECNFPLLTSLKVSLHSEAEVD